MTCLDHVYVALSCFRAHAAAVSKSVISRNSRMRSRLASHPIPAAEEIMPTAEPRRRSSASSMRSIMWRWPVKLMRSMPGVPSATPAHENSASTGPPTSSTAASIDALSDRSRCTALTPGRVTSARSMTTTSAPASLTSSAAAAPMPVAPPTTSARLPSYLNASNVPMSCLRCRLVVGVSCWRRLSVGGARRSGHDPPDLQVDDGVHVEAEAAEDVVAVLVELGCPPGRRRLAAELHGCRRQLEGHTFGRLAVLHVAVGDGLRVARGFEGVLHHRPLAGEAGEGLAPLVGRALGEGLAQAVHARGCVGGDRLAVGEPLVGGQLGPADDLARLGPVLGRLQAREGEVLAVLRLVGGAERVAGRRVGRRRRPSPLELQREGQGRTHRPDAGAEE